MAGSTLSALSTFCSSASPTISSTCRGATPMRKPSVRGSSAATHPAADATLLALAKECLEIEARHRAAEDHLIVAEERRHEPKPPREVLRTEADLQLGLFVGSSLGSPYSEAEIKALRVFCRSHAHTNIASNEETSAYF